MGQTVASEWLLQRERVASKPLPEQAASGRLSALLGLEQPVERVTMTSAGLCAVSETCDHVVSDQRNCVGFRHGHAVRRICVPCEPASLTRRGP